MRYQLSEMARRAKPRAKGRAIFRDIVPPAMFATDLYQSCYAPIVAAWERATPELVAEYERSLSAITRDSADDLNARIEAAERDIARLLILIRPLAERLVLKVETWQRGKWRGAILSATGVDIGTLIGAGDMRDTLGNAVQRNVALIRDVSDQARGRIADIVFRGLQARRPAVDVAREIRGATVMARARSIRIAADQSVKLTNALADERRREAGIDKYMWKHSGKLNGRDEHIARDGNVYSDKEPPPDMPGELPGCGCRTQSVLDF